ncbi:MAG: Isoquinoline 1-oxidoreductase subunit [Myxococcota bacterium]|nr:Isoquinoline 1-oxidoreductase subunit [Myxococcota bacterium]
MKRAALIWVSLLVGCHATKGPSSADRAGDPTRLREPEAFADMRDTAARSQALFLEASKVMLHPRCTNCHPPDDTPRQLMAQRPHDPPVTRGPDNHGVPGMECSSCHQDTNLELARVPGAPSWHLAPIEAVWLGRTPAQICEQLKDPARNGNKAVQQIVDHAAHDALVAWGWNPGHDREPAPGTQEVYGKLMQGWLDTGAHCPRGEAL